MGEIVLTRIDDRLIHGQVMTAWVKETQGNQILIIDDEVAQDDFMRELLVMSAPSGMDIQVRSIVDSYAFIKNIPNTDKKVIVLAKGPQVISDLLDNGCTLDSLVVGGMGAKEGRTVLYKNISASKEERDLFKKIINAGVSTRIHVIPAQKAVEIIKHL